MAARGFKGAGDLYIARYASGAFGAYEGPFECTKFEIKPNSQTEEMVSKGKLTYGQVVETVTIPQPFDLTVDLAEVNDLSLAIALYGTSSTLTQGSGSLSSDTVTITELDKWYQITDGGTPVAALGDTITVTDDGGTPVTYVEGVDYILNRTLGWIKALTGGDIAAADVLEVSGAYNAISGKQIEGGTQSQVRARFKLDGKNFVDDSDCIVTVHEAVVSADAAFDFLADGFNTVSLPGRMKTPSGFTSPFNVHLRNPA